MGLDVWWADGLLGAACLVAGLHHAALAVRRRTACFPGAVAYALMGLAMAAMFVPAANPLPPAAWAAAFVVTGTWFVVDMLRPGRSPVARHHVACAVAMIVMLLAAQQHAAMEMSGPMSAGLLTAAVALALVAWFLADMVALITRAAPVLVTAGAGPVAGSTPAPARTLTASCLTMDAAMIVMLLLMA